MASAAVYCTQSDVERLLSAAGLSLDVDDDATVIDDVIDDASAIFEEYTLHYYAASSMTSSRWCALYCARIAAYGFATRRGNPAPAGIQANYDRTLERLELVHHGQLQIPGLARRRLDVPTCSQPRIKLDPVPRTVIERRRTGSRNLPQDYPQHRDPSEPIIPPGT